MTKWTLPDTPDMIRAAEAAALRRAAQSLDAIVFDDADSSGDHDFDAGFIEGAVFCIEKILALISPEAQTALEQMLAEARAEEREALAKSFQDRTALFYPIEMPINAKGQGPAIIGVDAVRVVYEVWDAETLNAISDHEFLADAIAAAIRAQKGEW